MIKDLFKTRKKVTLEINGQKVDLYIRKPNVFDEDEARKFVEKELLKQKLSTDYIEIIEKELRKKTKEDLVELYMALDSSDNLEELKVSERLKAENKEFKDVDTILETYLELDEKQRQKADKILEKYRKAVDKELEAIRKTKKETLLALDEETLIKKTMSKMIELNDVQAAVSATLKFYITRLVEDENGNPVFSEEDLKALDQTVIDLLTEEIANVRQTGVELKKVPLDQGS